MRAKTIVVCVLLVSAFISPSLTAEEPATTQASAGPSITWPDGWITGTPTVPTIHQIAANPKLNGGADLTTTLASDLVDGLTLDDWVAGRIELFKNTKAFKAGTFSEVTHEHIGGRDVLRVDLDTIVKQFKVHYVYVFFQEGDYFCKVGIWAPPSHKGEVLPALAQLLEALK